MESEPVEQTGEPQIAALPELSTEEKLTQALSTMETERDGLLQQVNEYETLLKKRLEQLTHLQERLRGLEENPFTFALSNLDAGAVLAECGDGLQSLAATVRRRDAKGTLNLKITVKPFKGDALVFVPELKINEPKPEPAQSVFYANEDGALSRNDPRQKEFGFRSEADAEAYERANPNLR